MAKALLASQNEIFFLIWGILGEIGGLFLIWGRYMPINLRMKGKIYWNDGQNEISSQFTGQGERE